MAEPTVATNTYGSIQGVADEIGDISSDGRFFTEGTNPSSLQVVRALDRVAEEINVEPQSAGYTVPIAVAR